MSRRTIQKPGIRKIRKSIRRFGRAFAYARRGAWTLVFVVILSALLASQALPASLNLNVGDPAPFDMKAPRDFVDQPTTDRLRQQASERVADIYSEDPAVTGQVLESIQEAFEEIRRLRPTASQLPVEMMRERVAERAGVEVPDEVAEKILQANDRTLSMLAEGAQKVAESLLAEGIKPDRLESTRMRVPEMVRVFEFDRDHERFVSLLVQSKLAANLFFDAEATEAARLEAVEAVRPVIIRKDQIIVREADPVTEDILIRLQDAGLLQQEEPGVALAGSVLVAGILVGILAGYMYFFNPDVYQDEKRIVLVGLISLGTLLIARVVMSVSMFLVPVAAGAMLLAILINPRSAAFISGLMATVAAFLAGGDLELFFMVLAGALVGVFSVTRVGQRGDLMRAGFYVALANVVAILAWNLLYGRLVIPDMALLANVGWGAAGGLASAVLTIGLLPFLESFFGILTSVRLLELANPNQPLLRRLLLEAPGTYNHSIMVANLSEAAAERVGANSLLARVGAYYHDIGKMKRPYFFIENQFASVNPHDKLAPNLSALIITSHVKDGVELAKEYNLPPEIVQFIKEHHGTMLVKYFYEKALQEEDGSNVLEENFRYPGPKPRSKETAICMLADGAEATVRSMSKPTPGRIEATVRRIIRDRLTSGQLDNCDLTLADLDVIAETFTQVLTGIFHTRIEYPESMLGELEKKAGTRPAPEPESKPEANGAAGAANGGSNGG